MLCIDSKYDYGCWKVNSRVLLVMTSMCMKDGRHIALSMFEEICCFWCGNCSANVRHCWVEFLRGNLSGSMFPGGN